MHICKHKLFCYAYFEFMIKFYQEHVKTTQMNFCYKIRQAKNCKNYGVYTFFGLNYAI